MEGTLTGLGAVDRLDRITGIGRHAAQSIIAEVGLKMAIFPTAAHLASWTNLSPRAIQSGAKNRSGKTGKGNRYLRSALGEAAASAGRTNNLPRRPPLIASPRVRSRPEPPTPAVVAYQGPLRG